MYHVAFKTFTTDRWLKIEVVSAYFSFHITGIGLFWVNLCHGPNLQTISSYKSYGYDLPSIEMKGKRFSDHSNKEFVYKPQVSILYIPVLHQAFSLHYENKVVSPKLYTPVQLHCRKQTDSISSSLCKSHLVEMIRYSQ